MNNNRFFNKNLILFLLIGLYITFNLLYLTRFPFVHSDESWLSGLSRNIMEKGNYSVTETFFDLKERNPHGIKIIFHTVQILFLKLMGYDIFTFRFISLCFGLFTLYFTYKLGYAIFKSERSALMAALLMAFDVQFIYASHFARQEIIILFIFVAGLWYKTANSVETSIRHDIVLGVIIGLSIGIHPNSFIISLPFGLIYIYEIFFLKQKKLGNLAAYVTTAACFAALFVALSFYFDPNFISNYSKFGSEFDVFDPMQSKLGQIRFFYMKLFYQVSGTYYTPDIRFQFFLFGIVLLAAIAKQVIDKKHDEISTKILFILLSIIGINAGIILVGRFNQTSIVLVFPLFYILLAYLLEGFDKRYKSPAATILVIVLAVLTLSNYIDFKDNSYSNYLSEISQAVKPWNKTLGNLNSEYYFENGKLHDYRNLAFLSAKGMSFEEYIRDNNIEYIIFSEELDLIHELSPKWDGIYGTMDYYDDMKAFLGNSCELKHEFTDSFYGIRIVRYMGLKDWKLQIYKVAD